MTMLELLEESPIIAAVKDSEGLKNSLNSECKVIFVLYGTLCDIGEIVDEIKKNNKIAIVHVDMISGLAAKDVAVDFIKKNTSADGIISTKQQLCKHAKELGLLTIQRTFVVDSIAVSTLKKQLEVFQPDAVEIMPGIMPRILNVIRSYTKSTLIAGGLLADKQDCIHALEAGADGVSTTKEALWDM